VPSPRLRAVALVMFTAAFLADSLLVAPKVLAVTDPPNARWTLDDGAGLTADDSIGTANGTVTGGATWLTSGAANGTGALRLDGTNDFVTVPNSAAIEPSDATVTLWVRGDPLHKPRNGDVLFEKGSFACNGPTFGVYVAATGLTASLRAPTGQFSATSADTVGADLWDGNWHFIAFDFAWQSSVPPSTFARITIDGGLAALSFSPGDFSQTTAVQYAGATHSELVIGGPVDATCGHTTFKGDIDDVRLYDDPDYNASAASQMPPETIVMSNLAAIETYPGAQISPSVDLSPEPRFGQVAWEYRLDGAFAGLCCYVDFNLSHGSTSHIASTGTAPLAKGIYELRAYFNAGLPYSQTWIGTTLTVEGFSSSTTAAVTNDPKQAFDYVHLSAHVVSPAITGNPYPTGSVKFWDTTPVTPVLLGTNGVLPGATPGTADVSFDTNSLGGGTHKIKAEYVGDSTRTGSMSSSIDVVVQKRQPTAVYINDPNLIYEANQPFSLAAVVQADIPYAPNATVTFRKVGVSTDRKSVV